MFTTLKTNLAEDKLTFFLFYPENRIEQFMPIVFYIYCWQFAWNGKSYFLGIVIKIFQILTENFTQSPKG